MSSCGFIIRRFHKWRKINDLVNLSEDIFTNLFCWIGSHGPVDSGRRVSRRRRDRIFHRKKSSKFWNLISQWRFSFDKSTDLWDDRFARRTKSPGRHWADFTNILLAPFAQTDLNCIFGPMEYLGCFYNTANIFSILINELHFYGTNGSPSLPICLQYFLI